MNRRNFIKYLSSTVLLKFLIPVPFSFSQSNNYYEDGTIRALIGLILPVKSIDILKQTSVLTEFNQRISKNSNLKKIVGYGIQWLDFNSKLLYEKDKFLDLDKEQQLEILNYTFNSPQAAYPTETDKPWTDIRYGKLFLSNLRSTTMSEFYTSQAGWDFVGYYGPPQFKGNPDYTKCAN